MKMNVFFFFFGENPIFRRIQIMSCYIYIYINIYICIYIFILIYIYTYTQIFRNTLCRYAHFYLLRKSVLLQIQFLKAIPSRFGGRPSVPNAKQRQLLNQAPWFGEGLDVWENAKPKLGENIKILNPHTLW